MICYMHGHNETSYSKTNLNYASGHSVNMKNLSRGLLYHHRFEKQYYRKSFAVLTISKRIPLQKNNRFNEYSHNMIQYSSYMAMSYVVISNLCKLEL